MGLEKLKKKNNKHIKNLSFFFYNRPLINPLYIYEIWNKNLLFNNDNDFLSNKKCN